MDDYCHIGGMILTGKHRSELVLFPAQNKGVRPAISKHSPGSLQRPPRVTETRRVPGEERPYHAFPHRKTRYLCDDTQENNWEICQAVRRCVTPCYNSKFCDEFV